LVLEEKLFNRMLLKKQIHQDPDSDQIKVCYSFVLQQAKRFPGASSAAERPIWIPLPVVAVPMPDSRYAAMSPF